MINISILIATYNRCESLRTILNDFHKQEFDERFKIEVIVIDNNSNDQTRNVVEYFISKNDGKFKLKYLFEPQKGKSFALNQGIKEALGELLVFTDDDVILTDSWIKEILMVDAKYDFDAFGGRILPVYPENAPKWIAENSDILSGPIVFYDYGAEIKIYDPKEMLPIVGANMGIRKKALDEIGLFRTDLGPGAGTFGDDTELCRRMEAAKKRIYYCGNVIVRHPVKKERMNLKYFASWAKQQGRYFVIKASGEARSELVCYYGVPRYLLKRITVNVIMLVIKAFSSREFLKSWMNIFSDIGQAEQYHAYYKSERLGREVEANG